MLKLLFKNTKMIHARRILAVQTVLMLLPIVLGLVLMLVLPGDALRAAAFLAGCVLTLVVLFAGMKRSLELQICMGMLRSQSRDRKYFVPTTEVTVRGAWEETVTARAERLRFGSDRRSAATETDPIYVGARRTSSLGSDALECFVRVYSVKTLTEELYREIRWDAKKAIRAYPSREDAKHRTRYLKVHYGTATAVIVLADSVEEDVLPLAKRTPEIRDGVLLSAVVDCTKNRVYTDGARYARTMSVSDSQRLVGRLVFGTKGKLPRDSGEYNDEYLALRAHYESQTYGEFLAESERAARGIDEEEHRLFTEMTEGEMRLVDGVLYCMAEGRLMSAAFFTDIADEAPLTVPADPVGRVVTYDPFFLSWDLPKSALMTKEEQELYLPRLIAYMESIGYVVKEDAD